MINKTKIAAALASIVLALATMNAASAGTWKASHPGAHSHHHAHVAASVK